MKTIGKIFAISVLILGYSINANAQFWEGVLKAVEAVDKVTRTEREISDRYSSKSSEPSYTRVTTVSLVKLGRSSGNMTFKSTSSSGEIVKNEGGTQYVRRNGNVHSYYENGMYDPYESDSDSPKYYKYYVDMSGSRYYFNM